MAETLVEKHKPPQPSPGWQVPPRQTRGARLENAVLLGGVALLGAAAFLYPFLLPVIPGNGNAELGRGPAAPLVLAVVASAALLLGVAQLSRAGLNAAGASKTVALLGTLVALDAALRFLPSFAGASPIFALILVAGAVLGPTFGFLMGSLTLMVSASLTGGVGPWLPYQMLAAGWVGMTAGWIPQRLPPAVRVAALAGLGVLWGFGYGAVLNLYSWPFAAPGLSADTQLYWRPGMTLGETLRSYGAFYVTTSLPHDVFRAAANLVLIAIFAGPAIGLLERAAKRLAWEQPSDSRR